MRNEEFQIQVAVVNWFRMAFPNVLFTASAGGMRTSVGTGRKMKMMGYTAGCPDLIFFAPRNGFHGLMIELKREGGARSDEQKDFIMRANLAGYHAEFAFGHQDACNKIEWYMKQ